MVLQTTQTKKRGHHPATTTKPDQVVKLGFPVLHSERVALHELAAAHDLTVKDLLLRGAELMRADLERESGREHGQR